MKTVFITGISGYIASLLARTLLEQNRQTPDHQETNLQNEKGDLTIIGIDIREPSFSHPNLGFIRQDVRTPVADLLKEKGVDTIVHTAWVLPPDHDVGRMEDINVNGTLNILEGAVAAGVDQVLYTSSTTAYGFHPDNEVPLTEKSPLRGNADFTYAKNKREMEAVFKDFSDKHPEICTTVLRPCYVAGPGLDNPLSDYLKKPVVPLLNKTAPFQYVHEKDLIRVMILALAKRKPGIFNVAPEGTIEFDEMARMLGNIPLRLPDGVIRLFNGLAWHLRLTFISQFPNAGLNLLRHPWLATSEKLIRETGFEFKYTTRQAFQDFARHMSADKGGNP